MDGLKRILEHKRAQMILLAVVASALVFLAGLADKKLELGIGLDKETALLIAGGIVTLVLAFIGSEAKIAAGRDAAEIAKTQAETKAPKLN